MLSVGEGVQDAWESAHIHFEVTILRCDACACIIDLLALLYTVECIEVTILRCDACTCIIDLLALLYTLECILASVHKG